METSAELLFTLPETIGPQARVWIYQSNRELTDTEVVNLKKDAAIFAKEWQAHGTNLAADYGVYFNRFLALFVDESHYSASGCSIDSSVHFIQAMEKKYNINLLGRTQIAYMEEDAVKTMDISELEAAVLSGHIDSNKLVFNNLVATKSQMESSWIGPLSGSWHARIIS